MNICKGPGAMAAAIFSCLTAYAGTTVCAGKTVFHYSNYRVDFGAKPSKGIFEGEDFLSVRGNIKEYSSIRLESLGLEHGLSVSSLTIRKHFTRKEMRRSVRVSILYLLL